MLPRLEVLSANPQVIKVRDFVSPEEAAYLIRAAERHFDRSKVVCDDPRGCDDASRTSSSAVVTDRNLEAIRQRAIEFASQPVCESIQVVRYYPDQEFKPHLDAFDLTREGGQREVARGGQRTATILVYLNAPDEGGSTVFPKLGLALPPEPYAGIYWRHQVVGSDEIDPLMLHGGAPVTRGVKYAANLWLRGAPPKRAMVATRRRGILLPLARYG